MSMDQDCDKMCHAVVHNISDAWYKDQAVTVLELPEPVCHALLHRLTENTRSMPSSLQRTDNGFSVCRTVFLMISLYAVVFMTLCWQLLAKYIGVVISLILLAVCRLQGCKNRTCFVFCPEVVNNTPNQGPVKSACAYVSACGLNSKMCLMP